MSRIMVCVTKQKTIQPLFPGVFLEADAAEFLAMCRIDPPADAACRGPLPHQIEIAVGKLPAAPERGMFQKIKDCGDFIFAVTEPEERKKCGGGPVAVPDAAVGKRIEVLQAARSEHSVDIRLVSGDVRCHHDDVARLDRRILKQFEEPVVEDFHFAAVAVAVVDPDRIVLLRKFEARPEPGIRRRIRHPPHHVEDVLLERAVKGAFLIRQNYVTLAPEGAYVYTVKNNQLLKTPVNIITTVGSDYLVGNKFADGEYLVVDKVGRISKDAKVKIKVAAGEKD